MPILTSEQLQQASITRTDLIEYGYSGIGVCYSCDNPSVLYVRTDANPILSSADSIAGTLCAFCIDQNLNNYRNNALISGYEEMSVILEVSIYKLEEFAKANMSQTTLCAVCARPEVASDSNWQFIDTLVSVADTGDSLTIPVHSKCTESVQYYARCEGSCDTYLVRSSSIWTRDRYFGINLNHMYNYPWRVDVDNDAFCGYCFEQVRQETDIYYCNECEDYTYESYSFNGDTFCEHCYNERFYNCGECDELYDTHRGHDCPESEYFEDESNLLIHSYGYKPSPEFFGQGKWHLGFELEVEAFNGVSKHDGATTAQIHLGSRAYMKEDGSLNNGFEIVTHPHTLESYNKDFNWGFLAGLQTSGFRSWNTTTCGLHVHVSRTAFSPYGFRTRSEQILLRQAHELRFMKLIYDNQRQVERIAGRTECHYSNFGDKGSLVPKVKSGYQSNGRYSAVNTDNHATLEVRVFRGSLKEVRVRSALEFVHAGVEYTRDLKVNGKNNALAWSKFVAWVVANEDNYPNLMTIINQTFNTERVKD